MLAHDEGDADTQGGDLRQGQVDENHSSLHDVKAEVDQNPR